MATAVLIRAVERLAAARRSGRNVFFGLFALAALSALPGCLSTESWVFKPAPPSAGVSQVGTKWFGLAVTQDTQNGGRPLPGLAGRLYLYGADLGAPLVCQGTLVVDMYDVPRSGDAKEPAKLVERWEIDSQTLQKLMRKDIIGQGYTLFLPWATYRPEVAQVQLRVSFTPTKGTTVYGEPTLVTVRSPTAIPVEERQMVAPPR